MKGRTPRRSSRHNRGRADTGDLPIPWTNNACINLLSALPGALVWRCDNGHPGIRRAQKWDLQSEILLTTTNFVVTVNRVSRNDRLTLLRKSGNSNHVQFYLATKTASPEAWNLAGRHMHWHHWDRLYVEVSSHSHSTFYGATR